MIAPSTPSAPTSTRGQALVGLQQRMARQGYDLEAHAVRQRGWRATFYTTRMEHSLTSATGTGWERTPWHAVQGAARDALRRAE